MENNNENNIREPDQVKRECLLYDNIDDNNYICTNQYNYNDLDVILEISKNEYLEREKEEMEIFCKKIKDEHHKEKQNKFNNIKIQLNKVMIFDKPNLYYYELVLSIIEMYELGVIPEYKIDLIDYNNIFKLLKTIRIPNDEFDNLKKLIIYE